MPLSILFIFLSVLDPSVDLLSETTTNNVHLREEFEETTDLDEDEMKENPKRDILLWRTNLKLFNTLSYQTMLCGDAESCDVPFSVQHKHSPCCSCSCAENCYQEGSCCLAMYGNITRMHDDQRRSR